MHSRDISSTIRLKVAVVIFSTSISGGNNVIFNHCISAIDHNIQICMVSMTHWEAEIPAAWHRISQYEDIAFLHINDARRLEFDLVIFTYFETVFAADLLRAQRTVYFVQSVESRFFTGASDAARAEITYMLPMPIITVASWIANYLETVHSRSCTVIRNGVRKAVFNPAGDRIERTDHRLRVLIEGSVSARFKNVGKTIQTLAHLDGVEIWLLSPEDPGSTADLVDRTFCGIPIRDVPTVMRSCDVLVKLSAVEGMFGPPLEMFHCGGTAVTSDVTGHEEYMEHGRNGLVVPLSGLDRAREYVQLLAEAPELLLELKGGAARTAERWPDSHQTGQEFWNAVLNGPQHGVSGTREIAQLLRPFRLAVRTAGQQGRRATVGALSGLRHLLDRFIHAVNSANWVEAGPAHQEFANSLSGLNLAADDVIALRKFICQNYAPDSPVYDLAWHLTEYIYRFGMRALIHERDYGVAAFWFENVETIIANFIHEYNATPSRSFLWINSIRHRGLAEHANQNSLSALSILLSPWHTIKNRPIINSFDEVDAGIGNCVELVQKIAGSDGVSEILPTMFDTILIAGSPQLAERLSVAVPLISSFQLILGRAAAASLTAVDDRIAFTLRAERDEVAWFLNALGRADPSKPLLSLLNEELFSFCKTAILATPVEDLERLARVCIAAEAAAFANPAGMTQLEDVE